MIVAWSGSKDIRIALGDMQCGCDMIASADRGEDLSGESIDDSGASLLRETGTDLQRKWQCPCAGYSEPREAPECTRESLACVEKLTGASGFRTCPSYYTRLPYVARVVDVYRARKLALVGASEPEMSQALIDGVLTLDSAVNARREREEKQREREAKNKSTGS